jgi:glycine betaine/proline transport system substrate-binding protein
MKFKHFAPINRWWLAPVLFLAGMSFAAAATTVKFGSPPWPGETVKALVATKILSAAGYKTHITNASWNIDLHGVKSGDLDVDMGLWIPTQKSALHPLVESGQVIRLVANVPDAKYDLVVPDYVWKKGVHSIGDLNEYAKKFDHKIYGIEPGNDGNELMLKAIKNNTYDLGGWKLVQSSTAGMLSAAKKKTAKHQWIVFLGWRPHWMNIVFHLKYLKDPKHIWGSGPSRVYTVVNPDFKKNNANAAKFLKQMVVGDKIQSKWIYDYSYKKIKADKVAENWIVDNMKTVAKWLDGVKTADGSQPAIKAVKAHYAS